MPVHFTPLTRDHIRIAGADTRTFLQGLISQDINKVSADRSVYGTLLTPQGKFLHDFVITETADGLLFDCEGGRGEDLRKRLSRFRLRADVTLELCPELETVAVFGDGAAKSLDLPEEAGATRSDGAVLRMVDPRNPALGCRIVSPEGTAAPLLETAGISPTGFTEYEAERIRLAVPDGSRDMEPEKSTLLESNIDLLNGIDWEKGCYMGQELTARTKYRGLVKRRLSAFTVEGDLPETGAAVLSDGKNVGDIRSRVANMVLASVRVDAEGPLSAENGAALTAITTT